MSEIKGVDVSSWQRDIDWEKVKRAGIEFAIIRVGAGIRQDRFFEQNIKAALAQGINCGVYLYSIANTNAQALAEAKFTLETIKPYTLILPIAYDIEDKAQHSLSNAQRTELTLTYCDEIAKAGYTPMVYTSLSWFQTMLDLSRLTNYENWVAQWGSAKCGFDGPLSIWQHSNKGKVDGIIGDVDLNIAYKDYSNKQSSIIVKKPIVLREVAQNEMVSGMKFALEKTPLYISATSKNPIASLLKGNYWAYDEIVTNGRVRITNDFKNVGKKPASKFVTGYILLKDAKVEKS